jgi:hypothetical protein
MSSKYLVRPRDFHIFELYEPNGCYRSYTTRDVTDSDGNRAIPMEHFTYENLTTNYDFFPIEESEIPVYEQKNNEYHDFISWHNRSDGHGDIKGGTYEEYLENKSRKA